MLSIEDITNAPVVRDNTAPNHSQIGLTRVIPIDPAISRLLGSITYDREHGFNLEWDSKEAFKDWLDNEQTEKSIELRPSKIEHGSALYTTNQIFRCARNKTGGLKPYQKKTTRQCLSTRSKGEGCRMPPMHCSLHACPPVLHPTRRCTQSMRLHQCNTLYRSQPLHIPHTCNTLIHSQSPTLPLCSRHTCSLLPLR
jgi:hypothetical protein